MINPTRALGRWFVQNNIPTDGLTVILNFQDANAAARFDAALLREIEALRIDHRSKLAEILSEFEMNGIKVKVESPIHTPIKA